MKKVLFLFFLLWTFECFLPSEVLAQILINEFSSWGTTDDWVELVNIGINSVDLSQYVIRDSTQSNKITLSGEIQASGFATFGFSNRLNRSADSIRLIKIENSEETTIDTISYGGKDQVCAPGNNEAVGRVTDGGNVWERFLADTKNVSNNNSQLDPCPLPSETEAPTSKPAFTPTSFVNYVPAPTNSSMPETYKSTPQDKISPTSGSVVLVSPEEADGLVLSDTYATPSGKRMDEVELAEKSDKLSYQLLIKKYILPGLLTVVGVVFMIYALYSIIKNSKKRL